MAGDELVTATAFDTLATAGLERQQAEAITTAGAETGQASQADAAIGNDLGQLRAVMAKNVV